MISKACQIATITTLPIVILIMIIVFTGCLAHTLAGKKMKLLEELSDPAYYHSRPGSMYKGEVGVIVFVFIIIIVIKTVIMIMITTILIIIITNNIQINPGFLGDNQSLAGSRKSVNLQVMMMVMTMMVMVMMMRKIIVIMIMIMEIIMSTMMMIMTSIAMHCMYKDNSGLLVVAAWSMAGP